MTVLNQLFPRKTGEIMSEEGSESSSPGDAEVISETPKAQLKPIPQSTAHMIGWTLSRQVGNSD